MIYFLAVSDVENGLKVVYHGCISEWCYVSTRFPVSLRLLYFPNAYMIERVDDLDSEYLSDI